MGYRRLTLHATDMGGPLYASIGFDSVSKIIILIKSDPQAAH
jgi:hypothetical protein